MAYFHARYTPRGPAGNLRRGLRYYTFREEPAHPRGRPRVWHADDGRALDYAAARAEIPAGAREAPYTYRLVLSTKEAPLTPADYAAVLDRGGFDRWYFTQHRRRAAKATPWAWGWSPPWCWVKYQRSKPPRSRTAA